MKPRIRALESTSDADSYRVTFHLPDGHILTDVLSVSSWKSRGVSRAEAAYLSLGRFIADVNKGIDKFYPPSKYPR